MAYTQQFAPPHPRQSVLSTTSQASSSDHFSPTTSSTRFSLPGAPSIQSTLASSKNPANRVVPNIYERNLNKSRSIEVSVAAYAFLFSEIVQYTQKRVSGINDFERRCAHRSLTEHQHLLTSPPSRLNTLGYRIGTRVLEMLVWRAESSSKTPKREIRLLPVLLMIQSQVWKAIFGKPADGLEKSSANVDECLSSLVLLPMNCTKYISDMIIDNDPLFERHISVPRDISQLSCSSFTAGIVEAVLDGLNFVRLVSVQYEPLLTRFLASTGHSPQHSKCTVPF